MWFDSAGRRIARDPYAFGYGQERTAYDELIAHLDDPTRVPPPAGYTPPFYKAEREGEYRKAHAVFSALDRSPAVRFIDMPADLAPRYQNFTQAVMTKLLGAGFASDPTPLEEGVRQYVRSLRASPLADALSL